MEKLLSDYLKHLTIEKGYSSKTIDAYAYSVTKFLLFARGISVPKINKNDIIKYLTFLAEHGHRKKNAKVTRARSLSIINSFFRYLLKNGYITGNPAENIEAPKIDNKEASFLTEDECNALLRAVEVTASKYYRLRDIAIIKLFLTAGLRLSELVSLNIADVNFDQNTVKVVRKGGKEQILPLNHKTADAIKAYLENRDTANDALFTSRLRNRINIGSIAYLVKKYMQNAGIREKKLSPHTLRHSFCTTLLNKGVNIAIIQQLAGHKSLDTVRRYIHLTDDNLKDAINVL